MRVQSLLLPAALASRATATPTVYLAGDSTMAKGGGGSGTQGKMVCPREHLVNYYSLSIPVVNDAIAGRSARSYTREGRFDTLVETVKSGDWVIIEFGHNDGTSSPDNGRSDCPGSGTEVCKYVYNGVTETVYTFPRYLDWAAKNLTAKGANVLLSAQTPNNPAETGTFVSSPPRFVGLAQAAATSSDVDYVNHYAYAYAAYAGLTVAKVDAFFPNDHTHTAPAGAALVAQSFVRGLVCGDSTLKQYVLNSTSTIEGKCL